jgi:RNA polymerase sigma-70 factor (ECF subfamily)
VLRPRRIFTEDSADRDLARRLKGGDTTAMACLYDRFGASVYAIALRMVRNAGTAEDLVQETFLRIWNSIELFDEDRGALGAWVAAIARNRVLDHLRSLDWRMTRAACGLRGIERHQAVDPQREDEELHSPALTRAVTGLTSDQRRVLEMAYIEGLSQTEIAVRIRRPVGTVKTWSRGALKSLGSSMVRVDGSRVSRRAI